MREIELKEHMIYNGINEVSFADGLKVMSYGNHKVILDKVTIENDNIVYHFSKDSFSSNDAEFNVKLLKSLKSHNSGNILKSVNELIEKNYAYKELLEGDDELSVYYRETSNLKKYTFKITNDLITNINKINTLRTILENYNFYDKYVNIEFINDFTQLKNYCNDMIIDLIKICNPSMIDDSIKGEKFLIQNILIVKNSFLTKDPFFLLNNTYIELLQYANEILTSLNSLVIKKIELFETDFKKKIEDLIISNIISRGSNFVNLSTREELDEFISDENNKYRVIDSVHYENDNLFFNIKEYPIYLKDEKISLNSNYTLIKETNLDIILLTDVLLNLDAYSFIYNTEFDTISEIVNDDYGSFYKQSLTITNEEYQEIKRRNEEFNSKFNK